MATQTSKTAFVILAKPSDWHAWDIQISQKAVSLGLLDQLRGTEALLEKPGGFDANEAWDAYVAKTMAKFDLDNPARDDNAASDGGDTPVSRATRGGTASRDAEPATIATARAERLANLLKLQNQMISIMHQQHCDKVHKVIQQRKKVEKLRNFLMETVSLHIRTYRIGAQSGLDQWYRICKQLRPNDIDAFIYLREKIKAHYATLEQPKFSTIGKDDFEQWLEEWETIMIEGITRGIPESTDPVIWIVDLNKALSHYTPLADAMQLQKMTAISTNFHGVSIDTTIRVLRSAAYDLPPKTKHKITRGSFPTLTTRKQQTEIGRNPRRVPRNRSRRRRTRS